MKIHPFDQLVQLEDDDIRLDCAALQIARDAYPHRDLIGYCQQLDEVARTVADVRPGLSAPLRYEAMHEVLVGHYGFRGNRENYYTPDNSYLNRVLDEKLGLPITLSLVWIEVARRLKWPVGGVGLPGHFVLRLDDPERFIVADPYHDGRSLSLDDCQQIVKRHSEGKAVFSNELLKPIGTRAILARVLNNLRTIYQSDGNLLRLRDVVQRCFALDPENTGLLYELALIYLRLGDFDQARLLLSGCQAATEDEDQAIIVHNTRLRMNLLIGSDN
ncbi:MAG: hypothetical protein HY269_09415 [Deltaproteobacteria bacterium]|nr:hypothetical protein [Deltaproteobacteria bacterium]